MTPSQKTMLLGLYAKASGRGHVRGHGKGLGHARCAGVLRHDVEERFAERAVRLLCHARSRLCAGLLQEEEVCAQRLPACGRVGQHESELVSAVSAAIGRARLL